MTNIFSPNILEGEYSWNIAKTEIESGAMLAQLIGWDPKKSSGIYTFGGTGCYFYGLKLALTTVLGKKSRFSGIREEGQIIVSRTGHYVKQTCSDWIGLGMDNVREIPVDPHNRMDISALKQVMKKITFSKKIEVEVTKVADVLKAAKAGADIIMLDNFSIEKIQSTVELLGKAKLPKKILLEASGGITANNVFDYAKTGVDIVSLGEITHSPKALDLSLEITKIIR